VRSERVVWFLPSFPLFPWLLLLVLATCNNVEWGVSAAFARNDRAANVRGVFSDFLRAKQNISCEHCRCLREKRVFLFVLIALMK
jgi:hypothetical protein